METKMNRMMLAGAIGGIGLIFQIILGLALHASGAPNSSMILPLHMLIGIGGIALVAFLTASILFIPSGLITKLILALALLLTFAQVSLGFMLLFNPQDMLVMAHETLAGVILVLLIVGGILSSRARRSMAAPSAPKM